MAEASKGKSDDNKSKMHHHLFGIYQDVDTGGGALNTSLSHGILTAAPRRTLAEKAMQIPAPALRTWPRSALLQGQHAGCRVTGSSPLAARLPPSPRLPSPGFSLVLP